MDAASMLEIDPLGRLSGIYSSLNAVGIDTGVVIRGRVRGTTLSGEVRSGIISQPFERYLPPNALFGDELSPQARLPGLRLGQEWTVPVYSPLRFSESRNPVEVLHAKVEGRESVVIGDDNVLTSVVVYRSDSGSILSGAQTPRGKLWVADDGTVLKQTSRLFGSQLTFLRAAPERVKQILVEALPVEKRNGDQRQRARERHWMAQRTAANESSKKDATEAAGNKAGNPAPDNDDAAAADPASPMAEPKSSDRKPQERGE
jgi:hypothetical protein